MSDTLKLIQQRFAELLTLEQPMGILPLNPPMPEKTLCELEEKWRIRLPEDYRSFITTIGNGGAGLLYPLDDGMFTGDLRLSINEKPDVKTDSDLSEWDRSYHFDSDEKVASNSFRSPAKNIKTRAARSIHPDLLQDFKWEDLVQVKKWTPAQYEELKKTWMRDNLHLYSYGVPVNFAARRQRFARENYNIELAEDEYIKIGKLKGCIEIGRERREKIYLIVSGGVGQTGKVLLQKSVGGEKGGIVYELKGMFGNFFLEWLSSMER